jgi:hypothetical protein
MTEPEDERSPDLDDLEADEGWEFGVGSMDEAVVVCPYCGESSVIGLDAGGGDHQEYIEDCQVCCRPWQVHVDFGDDGAARVSVDEA